MGGEHAHVVIVVRRLDKLLPSQWQQRVQAGATYAYDEWLRIVLGGRPRPGGGRRRIWNHFWRQHDLPGLVARFGGAAGRGRLTLVVADESDRNALPRTFEQFLGLPEGLLEFRPDRSNRSLSLNETELVRHVNRIYGERGLPAKRWRPLVKSGVIAELKAAARRPDDLAITLPDWAVERVWELNDARREFVENSGWRVVGEVANLRTPELAATAPWPGEDALVPVDVAAGAVCATVKASTRRRRRRAKRGRAAKSEESTWTQADPS